VIYFETDFVGTEYNLEHPRVLWNSISRRGTVSVSTEATGFDGVNAATATQTDFWKPTAMPATWTLTFDATETIGAVAIDTHTLGTSGATVTVQEWTGAVWADVVAATPTDDEPIAFLFEKRSTDRIRISIAGATIPLIGVIHCSEPLELPQTVYMGAPTPIDMALVTQFELTQSATGKFMGRSVRFSKTQNDFTVAHLKEAWVRDVFMPFVEDAREYPYFLLERPFSRPTALSYRWREDDITPQRMGIVDLMAVSL